MVKFCNLYLKKRIIQVTKYRYLIFFQLQALANNISVIFTGYSLHLYNVKRALLQFQIQPKKLGRAEVYLITSICGFSSKKNDFRAIPAISADLPYQPSVTHKKHIFVTVICQSYLRGNFVAAICHGFLPWEFAAAIFRVNLPWACFVYVSKPFFLCEQILFLCK